MRVIPKNAPPEPDQTEQPDQPDQPVRQPQPVRSARLKLRHYGLFLSFVLFVVLPVAVSGWYLYDRAEDQYASRVGFTVRAQEGPVPVDLFEGLGSIAGSNQSDTDILYEFIQSQEMVELVDESLDLRRMYSKPDNDPVFAFDPDEPVETLVNYWQSMVAIHYDSGTGLIELRVRAFAPQDALAIAEEILDRSSTMINRLSAIAREDSTRYAREELDIAVERLKTARQALTRFRSTSQIVDPTADVQGQMTVLVSLQQTLAETYVEYDLLVENSTEDDPRAEQLRRQIEVIQRRIEAERRKFGLSADGDETYATLLAQFEELTVDLEFAETTYLNAMATYDAALREAQKQSRYLAAYLRPTTPQSAEFPQRGILLGLVALFAFLIWSVMALIYYSVRDRS